MKTTNNKYEKQTRVMRNAWTEFKSFSNWESSFSFVMSFSECLKEAWELENIVLDNADSLKNENVKSIFNILTENDSLGHQAEIILNKVKENSTGFQADIASKSLNNNRISTKQAWCVAYEFKAVA